SLAYSAGPALLFQVRTSWGIWAIHHKEFIMRRYGFIGPTAVIIVLLGVCVSQAWWVKGHETIAEAAASRLPESMPAFFRGAGKHLAHFAGDPDRWKNREANYSRAGTSPDHYIDL